MITFETKVWEEDWECILKTNRIKKIIKNCNYKFSSKKIFINNVNEIKDVYKAANRLVEEKLIDEIINVEDYAKEALDYFDLSKKDLGIGYYYSIAELVSIYTCSTKYLLHFSGDSEPENNNKNWCKEMINLLELNSDIVVANLTWNKKNKEVLKEKMHLINNFSISQGFSDQMYLIRSEDFKQRIYNEKNIKSNHYPKYGGELFEKRVHSWMLNNKKYRATYLGLSYFNKNIRKNTLKNKILKLLAIT